VRLLIDHLKELLSMFYEQGELQPTDIVLDKIKSSEGMDGGFLYFINLFNSLDLPESLKPEAFSKNSRAGRRYYLTQFIKPRWAPDVIQTINKKLDYESFDPSKHFNIHIEPQFSPLTNRFDIFLHFETNPYLPVKKATNKLDPVNYKKYLEIRSRFADKIKTAAIRDFSVGGGSNQIGKANIEIDSQNLCQVKESLQNTILNIAHAIDKIIDSK